MALLNNEEKEKALNVLKDSLKKHFSLGVEDVEKLIASKLDEADLSVVEGLNQIVADFVQNLGETGEDRKHLAKTALSKAIKIYVDQKEEIKSDFFLAVRNAARLGVDPYKLATETNYKNANYDDYYQTLTALTEKEYTSMIDGKTKSTLFNEAEVKDLFESCSTLLFRVTEKNVQGILDVLSVFLFDFETGKFVIEPKEFIKKAPSILLMNAKTLDENLEFLQDLYIGKNLSQADFVKHIIETPTLVSMSKENLEKFAVEYEKIVSQAISKLSNKFDKKSREERTHNLLANLHDINKLGLVSSLSNDNINNINGVYGVLRKHFTSKYTAYHTTPELLTCLGNLDFFKFDPEVLDYIICRIGHDNKNLLKVFINSPSKAFAVAREGSVTTTNRGTSHRNGTKREEIDIADLVVSEMELTRARQNLTGSQKSLAEQLIKNLERSVARATTEVSAQETPVETPIETPVEETTSIETPVKPIEAQKPVEEKHLVLAPHSIDNIKNSMRALDSKNFSTPQLEILTRAYSAYNCIMGRKGIQAHFGFDFASIKNSYEKVDFNIFNFDIYKLQLASFKAMAEAVFGQDALISTISVRKISQIIDAVMDRCFSVTEGPYKAIINSTKGKYDDLKFLKIDALINDIVERVKTDFGELAPMIIPTKLEHDYLHAVEDSSLIQILQIYRDSCMINYMRSNSLLVDSRSSEDSSMKLEILNKINSQPHPMEIFSSNNFICVAIVNQPDVYGKTVHIFPKINNVLTLEEKLNSPLNEGLLGELLMHAELAEDSGMKKILSCAKTSSFALPKFRAEQFKDYEFKLFTNEGVLRDTTFTYSVFKTLDEITDKAELQKIDDSANEMVTTSKNKE